MLEGVRLNQWQAECISRLASSGAARLELIVKVGSSKDKERPLQKVFSLLNHALWRAYLFSLRRKMSTGRSGRRLFHDVEMFACKARSSGGLLELGDTETRRIRSKCLDFVLYFGENTPGDRLATVAVQGIWCFRYGDTFDSCGALAAFWAAVVRRDNVVRVTLLRCMGGRAGEPQLLREGYFAVPGYSFKKTLAGILNGSIDFPVLACRDLLAGHQLGEMLPDSVSAHRLARIPGNAMMFKFLIQMYARMSVTWFHILLTREEWNTGFFDVRMLDPFRTSTARNVRWLPTDRTKNIAADPFFLRDGNKITLLVEKLDRTNNCGKIAARLIDRDRTVLLGTVIDEPFHSSYPCLIQSQGEIYCVPEQAESKSIMLYRAIDFPLRWERLGPLLSGVEAVDSTLFQHDGYWWLAYTDASIDRNGRLMLWYASELTSKWQPHTLNPVKIDPRCSRGAGPAFLYRGALVRPSQDCSVTYGAKVIFNRVIALSPNQFHEEIIGELRPDPTGRYWRGLHTISYDGKVAVIDGKRYVFDLAALPAKGRSYLRRHRPSRHLKFDLNPQSWSG
jgi:hypothetical protein